MIKSFFMLAIVLGTHFPAMGWAQSTPAPERIPTSYTLTGEALVFEETTKNINLFIASNRRLGPVGPYAYVQVGDGFSEFFVGPLTHFVGLDLGLGIGMGRTAGRNAVRANLYGFFQYKKITAMANHEQGTQGDWWIRVYADGEVRPGKRVGWFYQRDVGDGLRMQFDFKEAPANFWVCIDWDFQREVFGLSYTF